MHLFNWLDKVDAFYLLGALYGYYNGHLQIDFGILHLQEIRHN